MEPTFENPLPAAPSARSPSRAKGAIAALALAAMLTAWGSASVLAADPSASPSATSGATSSGGASASATPSTGTAHNCPNDAAATPSS
jgi:hypothetical protein